MEKILPMTDLISITGTDARYISNVLRMKKGETLIIMDGKGHLFESTIERLNYKEVKVKVNKSIPPPPSSPIEISLGQALIKSQAMDYLIQKTTELGINSIRLFYSERTVIKLKPGRLRNKMDRWTEIMKSACRQCGRALLPALDPPLPFEEIIKNAPGENTLKMLLWENEDKSDLKKALRSLSLVPRVLTLVGPEGGFTENEINLARDAGFQIISLGHRILRTETAAVSLISIVQYEWGDLNLSYGHQATKTPY